MSLTSENPTSVMIADDDDDDFLIFSVAIAETKFTVVLSRATDGEILMKLMEEHLPDILFLDLLMPCKDGRQCLKEIRSNKNMTLFPSLCTPPCPT